jgi:hypothetical protein
MFNFMSFGKIIPRTAIPVVALFIVGAFAPAASSQTLFTAETPGLIAQSDAAGVNYELGTVVQSNTSGQITAIRFWKDAAESGTNVGNIWSSTGQLLASVTFAVETASGWQQQALATPLAISADTTYVVSVNTGNTYYVATSFGLASQVSNGTLSSVVGNNGVYGVAGTFPTNNWQASNYFRDIVFVPDSTLTVSAGPIVPNAGILALDFGNVAVSSSGEKDVTLTNAGPSNVTISNVGISGAGFVASGVPAGLIMSAGQTATLSVTFAPAATGIVTGSLTVASNATNSPVQIALSGAGMAAIAHSAALSWTASTSTIIGYNCYSSTVSGGSYTKLNLFPVSATIYTDGGLQSGTTYYYVVTSVDSNNVESVFSNEVSATIP